MAEEKAGITERLVGESNADYGSRRNANRATQSTVDATTRATVGTTAGKGLGLAGKGGEGMPKQEPGESPAAFGARMRKYRETEDTQTMARKKALGGS